MLKTLLNDSSGIIYSLNLPLIHFIFYSFVHRIPILISLHIQSPRTSTTVSPPFTHSFSTHSPIAQHSSSTHSPIAQHSSSTHSPIAQHSSSTHSPIAQHSSSTHSPIAQHFFTHWLTITHQPITSLSTISHILSYTQYPSSIFYQSFFPNTQHPPITTHPASFIIYFPNTTTLLTSNRWVCNVDTWFWHCCHRPYTSSALLWGWPSGTTSRTFVPSFWIRLRQMMFSENFPIMNETNIIFNESFEF